VLKITSIITSLYTSQLPDIWKVPEILIAFLRFCYMCGMFLCWDQNYIKEKFRNEIFPERTSLSLVSGFEFSTW